MAEVVPIRQIENVEAEAALTTLLYFCSEDRLQGFTADGLAQSYNVAVPRATELLEQARRGRGL